ncbi:MAG: S-layer homology domain-containing protein [Eubacteriales bacterium]|jgi:hypothetical protein|nr:S-layer homology domain-containing protein [Eubacteriales bacterium]
MCNETALTGGGRAVVAKGPDPPPPEVTKQEVNRLLSLAAEYRKKKKGKSIFNKILRRKTNMSQFKKICSFVVAFAMALGLMAPMAMASSVAEDVAGTKYEEAAHLLKALNVMVGDAETGAFRPEDGMLRSEFAKVSVYLAGLAELAEGSTGKTKFPDVVENHWGSGYINIAAEQGYVIGDDVGTFRPDDKITYAEAITVLVRILGYEPSALAAGQYPTGYNIVAGQIGLMKNGVVSTGNDDAATRGNIALMANNALFIDMMERVSFGTDERYEVVDKTILEEKLDVTRMYGQVIANSDSTLTGSSTLKANEVIIRTEEGTETYKTGDTNAKDFLGRNVIFYVLDKGENTDKTLILVRANANKNDEITIAAENIENITGEGQKTLTYWLNKESDSKTQKALIAEDAVVFYNGVANAEYDLAQIKELQSGGVTLVGTNADDIYNFVFVTEYRNMIVDDISLASHRVTDKYDLMSLTLDPDDRNVKFTITKDGKAIELKDLKEWDVLSVAMDAERPEDATVINIKVSSEFVTGKITETYENKVRIGGQYYEVAANYEQSGQPALKLEDEGKFYLDIEGKIAAVDTSTVAGSNYAYLMAAEITGIIDNTLQIKIFDADGEVKVLDVANRVRVDNSTGKTGEEALDLIKAANGGEVAQLIAFELNSKGEVSYIDTAEKANDGKYHEAFSLDFASDSLAYNSAAKKLGVFNVNDDTIVFDIPDGETDPDNYAIRKINMFVDKSNYDVEIYDLGENLTAKVVIVKDSSGDTNAESSIAVVSRVGLAHNSDNVTVDKLFALQDGEEIELLAKDVGILTKGEGKLETGDIIQYKLNARGEIEKVTLLFDAADRANDDVNVLTEFEGTEMETVIGTVTRKFANSINVETANAPETNYDISNAVVYSYDYTKASSVQVTVVDSSYITKYDSGDARKVFLRIYQGEVKEVVIIKS